MIQPTIGRVVWYWPAQNAGGWSEMAWDGQQPMAATIAYVHNDTCVNLSVVDHDGKSHDVTSVTLLQAEDAQRPEGGFCEWMPFQKGQAAKTEAAEAALAAKESV